MNPSDMTVSNSTAGTAAIVHVPKSAQSRQPRRQARRHHLRHDQSVDGLNQSTNGTVDIRDEMVERFRRYYQRFVGYPVVDFQLPARTSAQYSLLHHTATHLWETPTFKAGIAGFGGVVTTLSVGFLLSDQAPDLLNSEALNYTLPEGSVSVLDEGETPVESIALDTSHLTLSDRPETIPNLEFSPSPESSITLEPIEESLNHSGVVGISLDGFTSQRFDVQLQAEAPIQPESMDGETAELMDLAPVDVADIDVAAPESVAIATAPEPPIQLNTEPIAAPLPDVATVDVEQQLSDSAVTDLSEKFAASLTDKPAEVDWVESEASHSTTSHPSISAPATSDTVDTLSAAPIDPTPNESESTEAMEFIGSPEDSVIESNTESIPESQQLTLFNESEMNIEQS